MSFQMVLLPLCDFRAAILRFGTMSFQMVLLLQKRTTDDEKRFWNYVIPDGSTTCAFGFPPCASVLELCHSRWFYYRQHRRQHHQEVLELCHSRWFYYHPSPRSAIRQGFGTMSFQMVLLRWKVRLLSAQGFGTMSFQMVLLQCSLVFPP